MLVLFWLFRGGFNVSSVTVGWSRISYGTDLDDSEMAGPVLDEFLWRSKDGDVATCGLLASTCVCMDVSM